MIGVVPALNACEGEHSRGFTFVAARGPGEDLFVSFHDLRLATQRRAAHYAAAGLGRGDRVALVVPEGEHFVPAFLGALWGGLIPVPLYPPVSLGKLDAFMDSLVGILNVATPRVLVTTDRVDRKSTRLNSSHSQISYAVFCLKKKKFIGNKNWDSGSNPGWIIDSEGDGMKWNYRDNVINNVPGVGITRLASLHVAPELLNGGW